MLGKVYEGLDNVTLFDSYKQRKELLEALVAAPREEPILLLGHGCPNGLYDLRVGLILDDGDAELLKEQTEALLANIDNGQPFKGNMRTIEQAVDDLINTYRERDNIMKNLNEED